MPRKKIYADRKERIVQKAEQLFNHYGYEKTTMEDISRESGIPRATIYLDFPGGKEDILMASIARYLTDTLSTMRELARQSRSTRLETLKKVILYYIMSTYDKATRQHYDPTNAERHCMRVREEMAGFFQVRNQFFAELLKQAAMAGETSINQDFHHLADIISQGMFSFLPPRGTQYPRETLARNADDFFSLIFSGLLKTSRRPAMIS